MNFKDWIVPLLIGRIKLFEGKRNNYKDQLSPDVSEDPKFFQVRQ